MVVLPDTSAWIEYLRGTESPVHLRLRGLVDGGAELLTCGPVALEVLAGARGEAHAAELQGLLARFSNLPVEDPSDYNAAASIYRQVRRSGGTVRRLTDCLIAAVALRAQAGVLHQDRDFDLIASVTPLLTVSVGE